ncbi:MAG: hypothetical protein ACLR6L_01510, partial [Agathobaculum sp.]
MRHTERCASPPVTRKYVVTSHNLSYPVLDIPTKFHQDIDNHLKGGSACRKSPFWPYAKAGFC